MKLRYRTYPRSVCRMLSYPVLWYTPGRKDQESNSPNYFMSQIIVSNERFICVTWMFVSNSTVQTYKQRGCDLTLKCRYWEWSVKQLGQSKKKPNTTRAPKKPQQSPPIPWVPKVGVAHRKSVLSQGFLSATLTLTLKVLLNVTISILIHLHQFNPSYQNNSTWRMFLQLMYSKNDASSNYLSTPLLNQGIFPYFNEYIMFCSLFTIKSSSQYSSHCPPTLLRVFYFCLRTLREAGSPSPALDSPEHAAAQALQLQAAVLQATLSSLQKPTRVTHPELWQQNSGWLFF